MDCSPPHSSVHGIFQARIPEWVAIFFSRGVFLTHGSNLGLLHCRRMLYHLKLLGKPPNKAWRASKHRKSGARIQEKNLPSNCQVGKKVMSPVDSMSCGTCLLSSLGVVGRSSLDLRETSVETSV